MNNSSLHHRNKYKDIKTDITNLFLKLIFHNVTDFVYFDQINGGLRAKRLLSKTLKLAMCPDI